MIAGQTRWYNSCSISQEDLFQEGQIGFFKAIRDYNPDHGIPFAIFAQRCVRCQFITALKTMQRLKHQPLNQAYSLDNSIAGEGRDYTLMDMLSSEDETINPEYCLIMKEDYGYCRSIVEKELTPFDLRIFLCYICGRSYQTIAANTGVSVKSVDNALHRSKQKLRPYPKMSGHIAGNVPSLSHRPAASAPLEGRRRSRGHFPPADAEPPAGSDCLTELRPFPFSFGLHGCFNRSIIIS